MESLERLVKLETQMDIMAPKVDAMYEMMIEQRGEQKYKRSLWDMAKGSKAVVASLIALGGYLASVFLHR